MSKKFVLFLSLILAFAAGQSQKIVVTKGQKLQSVISTKMLMSLEMMGQTIENNTESTATSDVEVKDVTASGFVFTNTTKRMVIKATAMGQDINFDSDKKEDLDGQMGEALKGRIGKADEITVDPSGKVVEMKLADASGTTQGMSDMMNMAGAIAKGQPYPLVITLPGKELKANDSWVDSAGTAATLKTVTNYKVKSISGDEIVVSFDGTLAKSGLIEQQGMEIQIDLTGVQKGDAVYERATGLLKKNTTVMDIKGTFGVMGQTAPLTMTNTITTVVTKQ